MNSKQRTAIIIAGIVMILMLLFPPFQLHWGPGRVFNKGYGFLFAPPDHRGTVDVSLLLIQWLLVVVLGLGAVFLFKDR